MLIRPLATGFSSIYYSGTHVFSGTVSQRSTLIVATVAAVRLLVATIPAGTTLQSVPGFSIDSLPGTLAVAT